MHEICNVYVHCGLVCDKGKQYMYSVSVLTVRRTLKGEVHVQRYVCSYMYCACTVHIYVGRKAWICAIRGLLCVKRGSALCATIHGLSVQSADCAIHCAQSMDNIPVHANVRVYIIHGAKYRFASDPRLSLRLLWICIAVITAIASIIE